MVTDDCADFETLLDHLLGELRLELSRKYRLDMENRNLPKSTEGVLQPFDLQAPVRAILDIRTETIHSMIASPDGTSISSSKSWHSMSGQPTPDSTSSTSNVSIQIVDTGSLQDSSAACQPSRPDAGSRVAWDMMMCAVMLLLIVIETTSLAIPEFEEGVFAYWWGLFLLVVFTLDVFTSFNTAVVQTVGRKTTVIYNRWQIAKAYLKGWFLIDALSTFPFDMVLGSAFSASGARLLKLGKILRTARLVKGFLKIAKIMEQSREVQDAFHEKIMELVGLPGQDIDKSQKYVSRVWCLFWFLLMEGHLIACFLLILTKHVPGVSWRTSGEDIHELDPYSRYVAAFRGVVYLLTTGNGDLAVGDILFTVLVMLFYMQLSVVLALFVGTTTQASGVDDQDFSMKCIRLRRYLRHHKVVKKVRDEVDSHLSKVGKYAGMNLDSLLEELPSSIRQSVTAALFYPFYENMAFFKQNDSSEAFEYEICHSLETLFYRPHDTIVSMGSALHGLHYLSEGYAAITRALPNGAEEEAEWCPEKYLFLESLFALKLSCASIEDVWAIEACEVWFLPRTAFDRLLQEATPSFRRLVELVRSKVHFDTESYSWVMEVQGKQNEIEFVGLDYLVEAGRFPEQQLQSNDDVHVLPPGKRFHYFLSHKKHHSKLGNRPELVAQSLHDALDAKGFKGFFDIDNLVEISRLALEQAVRESCAMIVVLNDETAESEWCQLEWQCAASNGIPVKCVLDAQYCSKAELLCSIRDVNTALLQYQWSEYLDRYRKSVAKDLVDWLSTTVLPALPNTLSLSTEVANGGAEGVDGESALNEDVVVQLQGEPLFII